HRPFEPASASDTRTAQPHLPQLKSIAMAVAPDEGGEEAPAILSAGRRSGKGTPRGGERRRKKCRPPCPLLAAPGHYPSEALLGQEERLTIGGVYPPTPRIEAATHGRRWLRHPTAGPAQGRRPGRGPVALGALLPAPRRAGPQEAPGRPAAGRRRG